MCEKKRDKKEEEGKQTNKQTKQCEPTAKFSRENKLTLKQMDFSVRLNVTIKLYERDMQIVDYERIESNRII